MKDNALYLEVDEDITSAIDKLSKTAEGSVQIVVPKRSTMLQSIINLKLLKKAADQSGKELVLVTNDRIAGDLASRVGLAVAPSIGAKPVLTEAVIPEALKAHEEIIDAGDPEPPVVAPVTEPKTKSFRKQLIKRMPVSDGPPAPPAAAQTGAALTTVPTAEGAAGEPAASAAVRPEPKVPNFSRLRRRILWLGAAVLLVVFYFAAMYFFTSATVTLFATGTKVNIDTTFTVDPALTASNQAKAVIAGQAVSVSKDLTGPFVPTGKKDAGTKASGTITAYNEYDTSPHALVTGTRFQAPDGKIFRTKSDSTVPGATVGLSGGQLVLTPGKSDPIPVEADAAGDGYNEAPAKYTIPGYSGAMQTKIYGQGAQMTGGTTKTVTITAQGDVDTEQAALLSGDKDGSTRDLTSRVPSGYVALTASQSAVVTSVSPSPTVGAAGDTGTLTLKVTYSVLAVKKADYQALIQSQEQTQVGAQNQVYDDGIGAAQVTTAGDKTSSGTQVFHFTTEAYSGTKLDKTAIVTKLKGQRFGDAKNTATGLPGVTRADINISPAWVSKLPSRADKITITIQVAAAGK